MLRTIPSRSARAIAGYSMGGFGAMNVALTQLGTYSVVESWEGQFANLSRELAADRPLLRRLPLHAFVWGGAQDTVVDTAADAPWAAAMRAAGAQAHSAVYPGAHAFAPIEAHLRADAQLRGSRAAKLIASAITSAWSKASARQLVERETSARSPRRRRRGRGARRRMRST